MKRIVAILLVGILLFNLLGYRLVYSLMENKADQGVELKLDNHLYAESDLVFVKIPMEHLPYYSNSNQYERVEGKIEFNGIQYQLVKQRVWQDSLELLCIPDQQTMDLQTAKDDFFKLVNDLERAGQGKKPSPHSGSPKSVSLDYFVADALALPPSAFLMIKKKTTDFSDSILSSCLYVREQPPKTC